jgi:AraC-like DNA-binding protein
VFRSEVGMPLHRYLVRARLAKALDAVLDAATDLASIAADAGFASHSHFTERFRMLFGVAPAELRRASARGIAEVRKILTADLPAAA